MIDVVEKDFEAFESHVRDFGLVVRRPEHQKAASVQRAVTVPVLFSTGGPAVSWLCRGKRSSSIVFSPTYIASSGLASIVFESPRFVSTLVAAGWSVRSVRCFFFLFENCAFFLAGLYRSYPLYHP